MTETYTIANTEGVEIGHVHRKDAKSWVASSTKGDLGEFPSRRDAEIAVRKAHDADKAG